MYVEAASIHPVSTLRVGDIATFSIREATATVGAVLVTACCDGKRTNN